jgi:hypothetical protein
MDSSSFTFQDIIYGVHFPVHLLSYGTYLSHIFHNNVTFILCNPNVVFQGLSRVRDGLLVAELDLNLNRQVRDYTCFQVSVILTPQFKVHNKLAFSFCIFE